MDCLANIPVNLLILGICLEILIFDVDWNETASLVLCLLSEVYYHQNTLSRCY